MRKKNRIIGCEAAVNGLLITVQTPNDQTYHRLYAGYSEREALYLARNTDFDCQARLVSGRPRRRTREK